MLQSEFATFGESNKKYSKNAIDISKYVKANQAMKEAIKNLHKVFEGISLRHLTQYSLKDSNYPQINSSSACYPIIKSPRLPEKKKHLIKSLLQQVITLTENS